MTVVNSLLGPFIDRAVISNTSPVRPLLGVRLDQLSIEMRYQQVMGASLPLRIIIEMDGRALLIKRLGRRVEVAFSDFEPYVATASTTALAAD